MIDRGKQNVGGILVDAIDYDAAVQRVAEAARDQQPLAVTALAVHGLMEGVRDADLAGRLNHLDIVTPDGQPVRWAMNLLHRVDLPDRCYGPTLMERVCERAAADGLPIYLYGSRPEVLEPLVANLRRRLPEIEIAGSSPSRFGRVAPAEMDDIAADIRRTGARVVFAGLGCPRQEVFAYEMRERLGVPVLAVGAAFDYHAGLLEQPPAWVQRWGLQWLTRLVAEPGRLWRRYLSTNPAFVARVAKQALRGAPPASLTRPRDEVGFA